MKRTLESLYAYMGVFLLICISCSGNKIVAKENSMLTNGKRMKLDQSVCDTDKSAEGLFIQLIPDTFFLPMDNVRAKLVISNNTDSSISYGERHDIEVFDNGVWRKMTMKPVQGYLMAWHAVSTSLSAHAKEEKEVSLYTIFYDYNPGRFRLCKEFQNNNSNVKEVRYAEFFVKY